MKISNALLGRLLVLFGILIFWAGALYIQVLALEGTDGSIYFYSWLVIQSSSWILALIGFGILLNLHNKKMLLPDASKNRVKSNLKKIALIAIISGLCLTSPLVQIGIDFVIAELLVFGGLILMLVSLIIWVITLFFPRDSK